MKIFFPAICFCVILISTASAWADGEDEKERLKHFSPPLVVEAAPFSSCALPALPATTVWGQGAALYGKSSVGRAVYEQISSQVTGSVVWSPEKLNRFALGGKYAFLHMNFLHTRVPPAIDEWKKYVDTTELNIFFMYNAYREAFKKRLMLLLTPYLRFHLPTDTSRLRDGRRIPIKLILGREVGTNPYFMVEPGVAFALPLSIATFYTSIGLSMGSIINEGFLLIWHINFGAAVKVPLVSLIAETGGFVVHQKNHEFFAWQASPGIRFEHKKFRYEISARFGLTDNSTIPYGRFTVGFAVHWTK